MTLDKYGFKIKAPFSINLERELHDDSYTIGSELSIQDDKLFK